MRHHVTIFLPTGIVKMLESVAATPESATCVTERAQRRGLAQGTGTVVGADPERDGASRGPGVGANLKAGGIAGHRLETGRDLDPGRGAGRGLDPGRGEGRGLDPGRGVGRGLDPGKGTGRGLDPGRETGRGLGPGRGAGRGLDPGRGAGRDPGRETKRGLGPGKEINPVTGILLAIVHLPGTEIELTSCIIHIYIYIYH